MTEEEARVVTAALVETIEPAGDEEPIQFSAAHYKNGSLVFSCANEETADWLYLTVPTLETWPGARLAVGRPEFDSEGTEPTLWQTSAMDKRDWQPNRHRVVRNRTSKTYQSPLACGSENLVPHQSRGPRLRSRNPPRPLEFTNSGAPHFHEALLSSDRPLPLERGFTESAALRNSPSRFAFSEQPREHEFGLSEWSQVPETGRVGSDRAQPREQQYTSDKLQENRYLSSVFRQPGEIGYTASDPPELHEMRYWAWKQLSFRESRYAADWPSYGGPRYTILEQASFCDSGYTFSNRSRSPDYRPVASNRSRSSNSRRLASHRSRSSNSRRLASHRSRSRNSRHVTPHRTLPHVARYMTSNRHKSQN